MSNNFVFIFGAGADLNSNKNIPLGNELVFEIFRNLNEVKSIILGKKSCWKFAVKSYREKCVDVSNSFCLIQRLYNNFKGENLRTYFFDYKNYLLKPIKAGIQKFELESSDKKGDINNFSDMIKSLFQKDRELITKILNLDKKDDDLKMLLIRFFIHFNFNIVGFNSTKKLKERLLESIEEWFRKNIDLNTNFQKRIFEELEISIFYEPEQSTLEIIRKIIELKLENEEHNKKEVKSILDEIWKKLRGIFDFTVIYDEIYESLLNKDIIEKQGNKPQVLRHLHFLLTMWYTFLKVANNNNNESIDESIDENYYKKISEQVDLERCYFINLNYTNMLKKALKGKIKNDERINYIHGNIEEFLLLNTRKIVRLKNVIENLKNSDQADQSEELLYIPNLVSQSIFKPILSIEMIERYYEAYNKLRNAEKCMIVGFGFNRDDNHIADILRHALEENSKLEVYIYSGRDAENNVKRLFPKYLSNIRFETFEKSDSEHTKNFTDFLRKSGFTKDFS